MRSIATSFFLLLLAACSNPTADPAGTEETSQAMDNQAATPAVPPIVSQMAAAHRVAAFHEKDAVAFTLELNWGGKTRMQARITAQTNSTGVLLQRSDSITVAYDGQEVRMFPAEADYPRARFDIFTWQYFFMAPFKFSDPGTQWATLSPQEMQGITYPRAKLTFGDGTGDAPDDWYIVYQQPESQLLHAMAYIVTFSKSQEEAEKSPHAISYHNYQKTEGVPFATEWKFWEWNDEEGVTSQIGSATISDIEFLTTEEGFYQLPEESRLVPQPEG